MSSGALVPSDKDDEEPLQPKIVDDSAVEGTEPERSLCSAKQLGAMMGVFGTLANIATTESADRDKKRRTKEELHEREVAKREEHFEALEQRIEELCAMPEGEVDRLVGKRIAGENFNCVAGIVRTLGIQAQDAGIEARTLEGEPVQIVISAIDAQRNVIQCVLTPEAMCLRK